MNLPNKITISRVIMVFFLVLVLVFPYQLLGIEVLTFSVGLGGQKINLVYLISFFLFVIASFSDFLDGYIARKYKLVTDFGKFMDPVADKILVDACLILLISNPVWINYSQLTVAPLIVVILISRDLLVDGVRLIASNKKIVLAANKWGKMKTIFQMLAIAMLFLNDWPFSLIGLPVSLSVTSCLLYLATFFSILSGIIYIYQNRKVFWFDK